MKDWHAIAGIVVLVVIFFRDIIMKNAFFWEDFMYFYFPARNFAAASIAAGELPLWNPYTYNGMPFQADIQTAIFYLPNLLLTLFVSDGRLSFYWLELEIIAHYMIAGVGMYYLARSYNLDRIFAFFNGTVFALSGFMITRAIHQPMICETAWLPLIILLFRTTLKERSVKAMLLTGLVLGHTILAGFPQLTLYIFFLLLLYFVFEWFQSYKANGMRPTLPIISLAGGAVLLSLAVAAIQLIPTIELAPHTQRAEMSYEKSIDGSLSWSGLITLVIPKFFGAYGGQGSNFWLETPYGQYWETCVYIGIAGLVSVLLAVTLIRQNRDVAFLFGIVIFSLLYAVGDSFVLHKIFFNYVPGFDKFREPGRLSFLWTFAAALLSGFGLQRFFESGETHKKLFQKILITIVALGVLLWVAVQQGVFQTVKDQRLYQRIHEIATSEAMTALVIVIVVCGLMFLRLRGTLSVAATLAMLFGIQFIDIHVFGFNQNNGRDNLDQYFASSSNIVNMVKKEGEREIFRINARYESSMLFDRNQGMIDRIFTMGGYSSLVLKRIYPPAKDREHVNDLLNAKYYYAAANAQQRGLERSRTYLPRAYMVYDAKVIKGDSAQAAFMASDAFNPRRTVVLEDEMPALSMHSDTMQTRGSVNITSYQLNVIEFDVTTPTAGYLSVSEIYYPDWKAYVDGIETPIYRANWNLRAVRVDAGTHHVVMKFQPASLYQGAWITFGSLSISGVGLFLVYKKSRNGKQKKGNA